MIFSNETNCDATFYTSSERSPVSDSPTPPKAPGKSNNVYLQKHTLVTPEHPAWRRPICQIVNQALRALHLPENQERPTYPHLASTKLEPDVSRLCIPPATRPE